MSLIAIVLMFLCAGFACKTPVVPPAPTAPTTLKAQSTPPKLFGIDPASWVKVTPVFDDKIEVKSNRLSWTTEENAHVSIANTPEGFAAFISPLGYLGGEGAALYFPRENAEEVWALSYKFDDMPPLMSPLPAKSAAIWLNSLNLNSGSKLDCRFEIVDSIIKRGIFTITAP